MILRGKFAFVPVAFALTVASVGSAGAMTSMADLSCDKADTTVMSAVMKSDMPASTGNLDKDVAAMMDMHSTMMLDLAKLEIRCGKDPNVKDAARRFVLNAPRTHRFSGSSE